MKVIPDNVLDDVAFEAACHLAVSGFIESDDDTVHRAGLVIARRLRYHTTERIPQ